MDNDFQAWYEGARLGDLHVEVVDLTDASALAGLAHGMRGAPDRVVLFSDEWVEFRPQCEAFLRARAGVFERHLGARACAVRGVSTFDARIFLGQHHLQGANRLGMAAWGLYEGEELVGVLTLGRHPRQAQRELAVLDRLCFAPGVQVVGGASRLLARAQAWAAAEGYAQIVSFSDHRLTPGTVYERLGFVQDRVYRPDYFYVRDGHRFSKQSQQKRCTGCPPGMTELAWASARGLVRCYDAGKTRWVLDLLPGTQQAKQEARSEQTAKLHAAGVFKSAHMRGYFRLEKNAGEVYFGSSYELRCLFELEADPAVRAVRRCEAFQAADGRWRNPDLRVTFVDGREEIWEVKPADFLDRLEVQRQIADSALYASREGASFRIWTERDSALKTCRAIMVWARAYLAEQQGDVSYVARHAAQRKAIRQRHYAKEQAASVTVACAYCGKDHVVLPRTYARNVAKHGGAYVCEALAGHIGGSQPKLALRKPNPHAAAGKKECCRCHQVHPLAAFDRRAKSPDGYAHACKACGSIAHAARYQQKKAKDAAGLAEKCTVVAPHG